jgi:predicted acetyltransferase
MTIDVRTVRDEEFDAWTDAVEVAFLDPKGRGNGAYWRTAVDLDRCIGAFDGPRPVGTFASYEMQVTVPGGAFVPMTGVTAVSVMPTHRRRGLLSRMMAFEFAAARERGEPLAGLVAAEYPIYGRFGYGPVVEGCIWELDARAAKFVRDLPGTVEMIDVQEARSLAPQVYERLRAVTPGAVSRSANFWDRRLGLVVREGDDPTKERLNAIVRDEDGEPVGYVRYKFGPTTWTHARPDTGVTAVDMFALSVEYEARLWKFLADHDWVSRVISEETRPVDELWRDLLANRRVVYPTGHWDPLWLRVLDPAAVLGARRYDVPGRFVLRIVDKDGHADGTFAVEGGPDGATCARSTQSPDVTLPVAILSSILLGGYTASRYAALGMLEEHRDGAVAGLSAMFRIGIPPWLPTDF